MRAARGVVCAARRASGEAVRRGVIVSRETHVHGDGICSRCSLEVGVSLDSMNRRCPSMRFYGAKMDVYELCRGLYVIESPFYDIEMGFYEIELKL